MSSNDKQADDRDTVLVLGAQGFIGQHLRDRLAQDYRLLSVDVRPLEPVRARVGDISLREEQLLRYDLGDPDQVDELFDVLHDGELDRLAAVVHLAAYYDFRNKPDARYDRLHAGLVHLLDRLAETGQDDIPLVYASSMASLAPTEPGDPITEESPRLGAWMYPASKIKAENVLRSAGDTRPVVELVLAAVYSDLGELVPLYNQIELVRSRSIEKYMYPGPVDRGLTYVHVDETVRAFENAIDRFWGDRGAHRFLIGQEEPVTYKEIHRRASEAFHGHELPLVRVPSFIASVGAHMLTAASNLIGKRRFLQPWMIQFAGEHFEFDLSHTREGLGWEPDRQMHQDLERILQVAAYHHDIWRDVNERRPW